jgi:Icc-related predicted phosphoesterase
MKSVKIFHISDEHLLLEEIDSKSKPLPKADIYVFTGDILNDYMFPATSKEEKDEMTRKSIAFQTFVAQNYCLRKFYQLDKKTPVVCVRGNHDFIDISSLFRGNVNEIINDWDCFEVNGVKFSGFRGVNDLGMGKYYPDEKINFYHIKENPNMECDVLITHSPPLGILDGQGSHFGISELNWYINTRMYSENTPALKAHLFGHVHEMGGRLQNIEGIQFSNAACSPNILILPIDE